MNQNDTIQFHVNHSANPNGVYIVESYSGEEIYGVAIFSTQEKAQDYLNQLPANFSNIIIPFMIDMPEWGNVSLQ